MDKCSSDAEFDSYWDYEAKNKNRNRIRVGRQYQATIPPLLKPGEKDGRKLEDLETLKWKPDQLADPDVEQYMSMARAVTSFSKSIEKCRDPEQTEGSSFEAAIKGLTEFVTSHHPCHQNQGCKVPEPISCGECSSSKSSVVSEFSAPESNLFAQAVEACGKNFCAIKKEYLPWKPVRSLIEYYYQFCKRDKEDSPAAKVPCHCICKVEKCEPQEPIASCSREQDEVLCPDTKEEPAVSEEVKEDTELLATPVDSCTSEGCSKFTAESPQKEKQMEKQEGEDGDPGSPQSTVGSLKFFLGGRLVLKLNAQQDGSSKSRCQWVQSTDIPKHLHQSKKIKHKKKDSPDSQPVSITESPKHKKKVDDNLTSASEESSPTAKRAKLKPFNLDTEFPPLCSASWTPPVADGQDSFELDDASSKTSEGCVSPVVVGSRNLKIDSRTETPVDTKHKFGEQTEVIQERKQTRIKSEPLAVPCTSLSESHISDDHLSQNVSPKSVGDEATYSHEVLNHRSALSHSKSAALLLRAAQSSSPSAKLFNKRRSPNTGSPDKAKSSPSFHLPSSLSCSTSSETSTREFVLDLSSRVDHCRSRDATMSHLHHQTHCRKSPTGCNENFSSSEGSPHTPCSNENSVLCCKSSNCGVYHKDSQVPVGESKDAEVKTCRKRLNVNQLPDANGAADCIPKCCRQTDSKANCDSGCFSPSIPCASPKCCKSYSPQEQVCNKEGHAVASPNQGIIQPVTKDAHPQKMMPWFGAPTSAVLQLYPHCYPYYVAYGMNQSVVPDASPVEIPLDLSSNGSSKGDQTVQENVPDGPTDLAKSNAEALERGMLYQLLKSKVTK